MSNHDALQSSGQQPGDEVSGYKQEYCCAVEDVNFAWDMAIAGKPYRDDAAEARKIGSRYIAEYERFGHPYLKKIVRTVIELVQECEQSADEAEDRVLKAHREAPELMRQLGIKQPDDDK